MSWFSKKEDKEETKEYSSSAVPEPPKSMEAPSPTQPLPKLPSIQKLPKPEEKVTEIKHTISPPPTSKPMLHEPPKSLPHKEHEPTHSLSGPVEAPLTKSAEPIFIKIDKFKNATENFEKVKTKVNEIETMLKQIQELKEKEEQELRDWEHEIQLMKTRVESIDDSLFKKLG